MSALQLPQSALDGQRLPAPQVQRAAAPAGFAAMRNPVAPDLSEYEEFVVFFSGGKDSVACALHLLELGIPAHRIELHHHAVDGKEGSTLMDWPCTTAYCEAFAKAFGFRYAESWKVGGFEREMLRENTGTAPIAVPLHDGRIVHTGGDRAKPNTRRKFPQVAASLMVRWCSAALKVDVGSRYLTSNQRFADGKKRLVITGERAQESAARAHYAVFEPHRADRRNGRRVTRWLDHWRPVHGWTEHQVWEILERWRIQCHPAYEIGLGRASCRHCVFLGDDQWATMRQVDPGGFGRVAAYEREFGVTIHRTRSVTERADRGSPLPGANTHWRAVAMCASWELPIVVERWTRPAGAFAENAGPC